MMKGYFVFKQKTAYEMRISDWSSDVCSSDLAEDRQRGREQDEEGEKRDQREIGEIARVDKAIGIGADDYAADDMIGARAVAKLFAPAFDKPLGAGAQMNALGELRARFGRVRRQDRSEERRVGTRGGSPG